MSWWPWCCSGRWCRSGLSCGSTRPTVRGLLGFGGKVTVIRLLGSLRSSFDYIVVGTALGATALGYYGMAYKLPELVIENVLWIFSAIALPAYSRARAGGQSSLLAAMLKATRLLALYGLAAGTALAVVARDAIPVLFSEQWTPAVSTDHAHRDQPGGHVDQPGPVVTCSPRWADRRRWCGSTSRPRC